jgi:hypothetical protein
MNTQAKPQKTLDIMPAGTMIMPASSDEAREKIALIIEAAEELKVEAPPEGSMFWAGQVFFEDGKPVEARLAFIPADALKNPSKKFQLWTNGTAPQIAYIEGQLRYIPDPENRDQISAAIQMKPEGAEVGFVYNLGRTPQKIKSVRAPEEVSESLAMLPNSKADRDFQNGLLLYPKLWGTNEEKATRYFDGREGHVVEYQPSEVEKALGDAPERALTALDERFNNLKSEAVADVIDILFHHWHATKDPQTNAATINAAKLCEYRNKTLSGENLELHWHALKDAFSFTLREMSSDLKARVFFSESEGESTEGPGAKYVYSPGFMLQYALKGQPLYFAPFLQKVWALDPVRENEAKRLARYLRADWRMNTQDYLTAESGGARAARWHTWAFLLAEAGIDVETYRKKANGKPYPDGPRRLIETIARAVETLYQMEVIAEGGFDIYHPSDRKAAENLPPRGKLDAWLSLRVCLAPSAALREALRETDGKRRAGRARDAKALATERAKKQLRGQREAKPKRPSS